MAAKILITEDEVIIAEDIAACLEELGYEVCAIDSGIDTIAMVRETKPDLVLLDINIKGERDGIETATIIKEEFGIPFIFLTAYADEKTIDRAKTTEPYGFIVKPFDEKDLRSAIEIALYKSGRDKERLQPLNGNGKHHEGESEHLTDNVVITDHLFVKVKHRMVKIELKDVLYVEAYDNYSFIVTAQQKYLVSSTLKDMESKLPSNDFVRIHRSYIVNFNRIEAIEENFVIVNANSIPIGKSFKKALMTRFNIV